MTILGHIAVTREDKEGNEIYGFEIGAKVFEICKENTSSLYLFRIVEGGDLPKALEGRFTTPQQAETTLAKYYAKHEQELMKRKMNKEKHEKNKKAREENKEG